MQKLIETIQKRVQELANDSKIQAHEYLINAAIATLMVAQEDRVK